MPRDPWQRARTRLAEVAGRGQDLPTFWGEATEVIAAVVPHYMSPCWYTLDPASLLATSHYQADLDALPAEWLANEYYADDAHDMAGVARSDSGVSTLHEATGGDPTGSARWQANMEMGGDQELLLALRTRAGEAWGILGLYREPGRPEFGSDEIAFLRAVAPVLADGARRGLLVAEAIDPDTEEGPGLIVLRDDWSVESLTPAAARWLERLPGGDWTARGTLPPSVLAVAGRALRAGDDRARPGEVALARVRSEEGRWMSLHGAALVADGPRRVAIIVEPAQPARIASLLMAAYGLSGRERDVTRLVLRGEATGRIAADLGVSPHTVQQHLKGIFEKTGVRTRRELVGRVFLAHYEPRLRDNERRVREGRPIRGGPTPAGPGPSLSAGSGPDPPAAPGTGAPTPGG